MHAHVRCCTSQLGALVVAFFIRSKAACCTVTICCDLQHNTGFPYGLPRDSSFRYSCVNNSVKLHMTTDDPSMAPPPLSREYGGLAALHAVTRMCVEGCGGEGGWAARAMHMLWQAVTRHTAPKSHVMQERIVAKVHRRQRRVV